VPSAACAAPAAGAQAAYMAMDRRVIQAPLHILRVQSGECSFCQAAGHSSKVCHAGAGTARAPAAAAACIAAAAAAWAIVASQAMNRPVQ
jgi:hypothetical protein